MLPRRHILDVWEFFKEEKALVSMSTITLAIDAIKHVDAKDKKDHLVEALELNEFICYMYPGLRPKNRALLFHVVSDLLGLLMYGVPSKSRKALENIETINYSEKNIEIYPVVEVWNHLKDKVYLKKHGAPDVVEGFVKKIRIEMDIFDRYPFVDDVFAQTRMKLREWLPSLASYYDRKGKSVADTYDKWWDLWRCGAHREEVLSAMVERLAQQASREFDTIIDKEKITAVILKDKAGNSEENELFSRWYREGVQYLLKI